MLRVASILLMACGLFISSSSWSVEQEKIRVALESDRIGLPPNAFEFWRTGEGDSGQWRVVKDTTAVAGVSIEHSSADQTEDRYPLAVYKPVFAKNFEVTARLMVVGGRMQSAGIAFRVNNAANYYLVRISALEGRVDLFRVVEGKLGRVAGIETSIVSNRWHRVDVLAVNEQFAVAIDNRAFFRASDQTFVGTGYIGLWTEEDNVTRFEEIEIVRRDLTK